MLANKILALNIIVYCSLPHSLLLYVLPLSVLSKTTHFVFVLSLIIVCLAASSFKIMFKEAFHNFPSLNSPLTVGAVFFFFFFVAIITT